MTSRFRFLIAMTVGVALALVFAGYGLHSAGETARELALLRRSAAELAATQERTQATKRARQKSIADLQALLRTASAEAAKKGPAAAPPRPAVTPLQKAVAGKGPAVVGNGPGGMMPPPTAAMLKQWRLLVPPLVYRLMYQRRGLTDAQIEKFEDLAMAHQEDLLNLQAAATAQGFNGAAALSSGLETMIKKSNEEFFATVSREMGPDIGHATAENDRYFEAQSLVGSIEDRLLLVHDPTAIPLTGVQAGRLSEILADNAPAFRAGGNSNLIDLDWDRALAQAATFLSGAQLRAVQDIAELRRLQAQIREFYGPRYLRNDK